MLSNAEYLQKILTARVYDVAHETPLDLARTLSRRLHNTVLLKREDQQPVRSFKLRGAYNKMANLRIEQLEKGVICASAGNHAQGVALSAHRMGVRAVIVMPTTTPQVKVDAVRGFGGTDVEVVLHGESYSDAYAHALQAEMHRLQYDLMRLAPATHAVDIPADYGAPSPAALRCAYCATYFVPAGRSCGCGANRAITPKE